MVIVDGDTVNFVAQGKNYQINISLKNNSEYEAKEVHLIDIFPDSITATNFSVEPTTVGQDTADWIFATLPPSEEQRISFIATVPESMPVGERWLFNTVVATAENEFPNSQLNNTSRDSVFNRVDPLPPNSVDIAISQSSIADSAIVIDDDSV